MIADAHIIVSVGYFFAIHRLSIWYFMVVAWRWHNNGEQFGRKATKLADSKHLWQGQVARLVSVEKSSISMYETGMRQPSIQFRQRELSMAWVEVCMILMVL